MKKRENFTSIFLFFTISALIILIFSKFGFLSFPSAIIHKTFSSFQAFSFRSLSLFGKTSKNSDIKKLEEDNKELLGKLVNQEALLSENKALRDQFETTSVRSQTLLAAKIIGAPSFILGVSSPQSLIIDKGTKDNVRVGNGAIYKDNLVGKVTETSLYFSKVILVTNPSFSTTIRTLRTKSLGTVKGGEGNKIILDNILQSDDVKTGDILLTKGDMNIKGQGIPPNLIIGKITSVNRKPSDLYRKGEAGSLLDISALSSVFIINN